MKVRICVLAACLLLLAAGAFAHGDKVHVLGTIEKISPDSLTVKAKDGKSVEVKLVTGTVYLERANGVDKPAKLSDLAVGDLVVLHATPKDNILEADEVKFTVRAASRNSGGGPSKPKP